MGKHSTRVSDYQYNGLVSSSEDALPYTFGETPKHAISGGSFLGRIFGNAKQSHSKPPVVSENRLSPEKAVGDTQGLVRRMMFWRRRHTNPTKVTTRGDEKKVQRQRSIRSLFTDLNVSDVEIASNDEAKDKWLQWAQADLGQVQRAERAERDSDALDAEVKEADLEARENVLSKIPPHLRDLDVTNSVIDKGNLMVASGGYCDVFIGRMISERLRCRIIHRKPGASIVTVAIKRLRVRLNSDEAELIESFTREMTIWAGLDHPNILPFIGYVLEFGYPSLVSEWMVLGSLREFLKKSHPECNIVQLALGIAEGLKHLHDRGVVHSDMKADNVLISETLQPLICDFGISRMIDASQTLLRLSKDDSPRGSTRWMAKELLQDTEGVPMLHSRESDVWAYGMTLYEMVSRQLPYAHLKNDIHVFSAVVKGKLPELPATPASSIRLSSSTHSEICSLCTCCWEDQPNERPTMAQITRTLSSLPNDPPESALQQRETDGSMDVAGNHHKPPALFGPSDNTPRTVHTPRSEYCS